MVHYECPILYELYCTPPYRPVQYSTYLLQFRREFSGVFHVYFARRVPLLRGDYLADSVPLRLFTDSKENPFPFFLFVCEMVH